MLATILIIGAMFSWLMYETNCLTIRLIIGAIPPPEAPEVLKFKTWAEIQSDINRLPVKYQPFWHKFPENMTPLCGLDWLETRQHIIPIYKFVIKAYGVTSTTTLKVCDAQILKQVCQALLKPNKQERLELNAQRKQSRKLAHVSI
jgi:hypothetical protein